MSIKSGISYINCKWGHPRDSVTVTYVNGRETLLCLKCKSLRNRYYRYKTKLKEQEKEYQILPWEVFAGLEFGRPVKRILS